MDKKKNIGLVLGIIAGIAVVAGIATATIYVLRSVDQNQSGQSSDTNDKPSADGANKEKREKAAKAAGEAEALMESDPLKASEKYKEAADLYKEAGDQGTAADMADNARTAAAMTPAVDPEIGDPVISR